MWSLSKEERTTEKKLLIKQLVKKASGKAKRALFQ